MLLSERWMYHSRHYENLSSVRIFYVQYNIFNEAMMKYQQKH